MDADDPARLDAAMTDLLHAPSWDDVRQALDRHPILMSTDALKPVIEEANQAGGLGQHDRRVWLLMHADLLGRCQELGIEQGFTAWKQALSDQIKTGVEWVAHYLRRDPSALNQALEEALWALMAARRPGPLAQFWDDLLQQLRYLIQQWIAQPDGGITARVLLVSLLRENAARVEKSHPSWPERIMSYSGACADWFQANGDAAALDRSIELAEQAVAQRPQPDWISRLGRLRLFRFELTREVADLRAAIADQRRALERIGAGQAALRSSALDRLGIALRTSFEYSGVVEELNEAVRSHEEAVRVSPADDADHPGNLGNLAAALFMRTQLTGDSTDRRRAGELLRQEVKLCGPGHPLRPDALANLAAWLTADFEKPESVTEAITSLREAIDLAGDRHVRWLWELSLAQALLYAAGPSPEDEWRLEAGRRVEAALEKTAPSWPGRPAALTLKGRLQAEAGLDEAGATLAQAVELGTSADPDAARAAVRIWRNWAIGRRRLADLETAADRGLDLLDGLSLRQRSPLDQVQWRQRARPEVEDTSYALADAGETELAVAHLERGRATVLRQALELESAAPSVAHTLDAVRPSAAVVYLIAAEAGGVALIPAPGGIGRRALPKLTLSRVYEAVTRLLAAQEKRTQVGGAEGWRRQLDNVTRWMHEAVVEPLEDFFAEHGPDVALLGDGLIELLPWAAAWEPDGDAPGGRRYLVDRLDLVVAPTAGVLARALAQAREVKATRVLVVAPLSHGASALTHVESEVAAVARAYPETVELRAGATPAKVLQALQQATVVHFACHGRLDLRDPLQSYLSLTDDEPLRVADLLTGGQQARRLAVLSACETSAAGLSAPTEVIGFPAAFLRLGFASVVGSLWPVRDDGTALLMSRFHQVAARQRPAAALADAQRWLRRLSADEAAALLGRPVDGEFSSVETWSAFTCTGA